MQIASSPGGCQQSVSVAVRKYLKANLLTQVQLGRQIGMPQSSLNAKLTGARPWSLADCERLARAGVLPPLFPSLSTPKEQ